MKLPFSLFSLFMSATFLWAQNPTIIEAAGWLEAAYVTWKPVNTADSYNVYYSGEGVTDQKLDNQLIRRYDSYYRADAIGLAPGSYTLKVVPVIDGREVSATTSSIVNVKAHDRSGFAFSNAVVPGAYKADGTPKSGAVILYITEKTKNTVSLEVTGANTNPCVGLQGILDGFKKAKDTRPLIVRFVGNITDLESMNSGDIVVENSNNASSFITLEGVGIDATINGWGIRLKNASNIEVRNLGFMNVDSDEGDNLSLQQKNDHIWVHHNDFFYGDAGSDADQAKGDGALDCKKSTFVTFSYNHFWDTGKSNLLGLSENTTEGLYITYHHNWYDHSDSRHPRVRFYSAHVYNNYYDGISKYGIGSTNGASVFAEGNYFRNCKYPMLISMQGTDVWNESKAQNDYTNKPTFSKEDGGIIKAFDNYIEGAKRFVAFGSGGFDNSSVDFDAYVVSSKNTPVPSTVVSAYGNNVYNNFDLSSVMYSYTAESPEEAKASVMAYAGRMNGGDFLWNFNNAVDDTAYSVNTALKLALVSYSSSLLGVQGDGSVSGNNPTSSSSSNSEPTSSSSSKVEPVSSSSMGSSVDISADIVHNFTIDGTTSSYFNINGNLSTSKGSVFYAGLSLTQCLKVESSTQITFNLTEAATLTLVFNSDFSKKVKINDKSYTAVSGVLTVNLDAGNYTITKGDSGNLYYMSLALSVMSNSTRLSTTPSVYFDDYSRQVYFSKGVEVEYLDVIAVNGKILHRVYNHSSKFDLSHLKSGLYIVLAKTNFGKIQKTIYKK